MLSFSRLRPRQAGRLSLRKRAAKPLIARRAFLSLTFIQATLHAFIPACDSAFVKFHRDTVHFCIFSLLHRTFPRIKNARPCDFCSRFIRGQLDLFALCSHDCAFFSVNSAYTMPSQRIFSVHPRSQRKSQRKFSLNAFVLRSSAYTIRPQ